MSTIAPTGDTGNSYLKKRLFKYRLRKNFEMLCKNFDELKNQFNKLHDPLEIKRVWHNVSPDDLDKLIFEITRYLSNFVCMIKAIVDVNRVLLNKKYRNTKFLEENQREIDKRFSNNPLVCFVSEVVGENRVKK